MSLFGDVVRIAAPVAAGWYGGPALAGTFGGSAAAGGIAAGAFTGMGIAALTGEDLLAGGLSGAFGGYSGQGLQAAFNPAVAGKAAIDTGTTTAVANDAMMSPYTGVAQGTQEAARGSQLGMFSNPAAVNQGVAPTRGFASAIGPNTQTGLNSAVYTNPTPASVAPNGANIQSGTQLKAGYGTTGNNSAIEGIRDAGSGGYAGNPAPPDTSFGASMDRYGYGRAGLMALPLLMEEEEYDEYDESKDEYDPYATLNLNDIDTGIGGALKEDSGLRLYADGGIVNQTPMNVNNVGANMGLDSVTNLSQGASNIQGLGALNVNSGAMGLTAEQQDLIDNPKYRLENTGIYGQQRYVPTDYTGMGRFQDDLMGTTQKAGEAEAAEIAALQKQLEGSGTMNVNDVGSSVMSGGMNVNNLPTTKFAMGGLTEGPGDGMSDDIPATIDNNQPAALSDGEFVVPADVVSHLGNGSTEAGSKQLYAMMDEVRQARTGRKQQGTEIDPERYMPA